MTASRADVDAAPRRDDRLDAVWTAMRVLVGPVVHRLTPSFSYGVERVPASGGAVLAANHLSAIDHALLALLFPRPICFVSKAELMAVPIVGRVLTCTGAFPVRRGEPDRAALARARELVRSGRVVGVHLEGTRQRLGYPGEFKAGGLVVAVREGVPVIPCGIESFGWSLENRRPCAVVFGDPMALGGVARNRRGYDAALEIVRAEIVRLWREAAEAVAAGFPPVIAGRARRGPVPPTWRAPTR